MTTVPMTAVPAPPSSRPYRPRPIRSAILGMALGAAAFGVVTGVGAGLEVIVPAAEVNRVMVRMPAALSFALAVGGGASVCLLPRFAPVRRFLRVDGVIACAGMTAFVGGWIARSMAFTAAAS